MGAVPARTNCFQQASRIVDGIVAAISDRGLGATLEYRDFRCDFLGKPSIICIEKCNVPAARVAECIVARGSRSGIGLPQDVEARIVDCRKPFVGLIGGTVVDYPNLERTVRLLQCRPNCAENQALALVDGDDYGDERAHDRVNRCNAGENVLMYIRRPRMCMSPITPP